jgi:hypothetical protein
MEQMRLTRGLSIGQRIQRLLHARALAVGLIRGRLRRRYPVLSTRELNSRVGDPDLSLFLDILQTFPLI